ncbi:hypothetical protein [Limnobacter sp.]|uniref:hypothetical protein n=1 Tax=Limnobacter sp. TaxID=2003368 RepID=UPI002FE2BE65
MIEFLFSLLLVPVLPELEDPAERHAVALKGLEQRLNQGRQGAGGAVGRLVAAPQPEALSPDSSRLPAITGRLFEWSSVNSLAEQGQVAAYGLSAESLQLTGLIESSGQRVAILNDGEKDHVVGLGSYVLGTYQVVAFGRGQVVLMPLDTKTGGKRLELNLIPGVSSGEF